jgi:predicted nucleic acid-binding protein
MSSTTVSGLPAPELIFVDTNVLVYAHDASETRKKSAAQALLRELWDGGNGALSTQVLQEFYVVATRKYNPPMSRAQARQIVALYSTWGPVGVDMPLILAASRLEETHTLSFWDALIVEAARRAGAVRLMTEDLQDGRDFDGVAIEDPFV